MMKEEDAMGLMVLISPVLWTNDHCGKIGLIDFTDFEKNEVWVAFDDDEVECFSSKIIFVLKTTEELNALSEKYRSVNWPPVSQNLKTLAMLQASGSTEQLRKAYELVQDDPELHREATIRLNEVMDLTPAQKVGR